ncbi:MAG: hypothetical protein AB8H86_04260 [Polyangiales bacterium]
MIHPHFGVRIPVSEEVAIGICVVAAIMLLLAFTGEAARKLRERIPKAVTKWVGALLGVALTGAGFFFLQLFLTETIANERAHLGVRVVDSIHPLAAAVLVAGGAASFYWGRWVRSAAAFAPFAAVALILKPFVWPLQFYRVRAGYSSLPYGSRPVDLETSSLFSETHLYFILPGIALLVLSIVLIQLAITRAKVQR